VTRHPIHSEAAIAKRRARFAAKYGSPTLSKAAIALFLTAAAAERRDGNAQEARRMLAWAKIEAHRA
jgi:hypothetical protein